MVLWIRTTWLRRTQTTTRSVKIPRCAQGWRPTTPPTLRSLRQAERRRRTTSSCRWRTDAGGRNSARGDHSTTSRADDLCLGNEEAAEGSPLVNQGEGLQPEESEPVGEGAAAPGEVIRDLILGEVEQQHLLPQEEIADNHPLAKPASSRKRGPPGSGHQVTPQTRTCHSLPRRTSLWPHLTRILQLILVSQSLCQSLKAQDFLARQLS